MVNFSSRRFRKPSLLAWIQALVLCLFVQSAFGCFSVHAGLCAEDESSVSQATGGADQDCDALCAHCHGGCTHCALAALKPANIATPVSNLPPVHAQQRSSEALQLPLLRPPAFPV